MLQILAKAIRQENNNKRPENWKISKAKFTSEDRIIYLENQRGNKTNSEFFKIFDKPELFYTFKTIKDLKELVFM